MSHFVLKNADGSISVVHLTDEAYAGEDETTLTHQQAIQAEFAKLQSRGDIPASSELVAENIELPETREWRKAWRWMTDEPIIDICPHTAREIIKDNLRVERTPELLKLDIEFMQAIESGQPTAEIAEKKQLLRDVTDTLPEVPVDMVVATPEFLNELKAISLPV